MKLAPSLSVINIPLVPECAVMVPAVVRIFAPEVPILLAEVAGVVKIMVPLPTSRRVPAV